jgi:methylthioribose-1-phosphate isomerase
VTVEPVDPIPPTVAWSDGAVRLVDQRRLPGELAFVDCRSVAEVVAAIRDLTVRGAPALGATGAFGVALAATMGGTDAEVAASAAALRSARPTAVNLAWGVDEVLDAWRGGGAEAALAQATAIAAADVAANRALGAHGAALLPPVVSVLTHCNAGALACVGYGTAIGMIRTAHERGQVVTVWVDETRPVLQGARLTAWELGRAGIPHRVIADAAAGGLMARGLVDRVVVGADRIAANGDVANKVGTYPLAVLAARHEIPFHVAAPLSTIDPGTATGADIPIEERDPGELLSAGAPAGSDALNPAFDVTPAELVGSLITEAGVLEAPYAASIAAATSAAAR